MGKRINKTVASLTEDQFYEKYNPIKNHFYQNPEDCSFDGCMFETYGQELDYIKNLIADGGEQSVWTIIEGEDDSMFFASGFHFVNRMGYIVTEEPVPDDVEIIVELDTK